MKYHMSSTTAFILLLVTVPMPLISYADNSRTTLVGSCSNVSSGFCNEFTGSSYTTKAVQRTCEKNKMVFLSGACPVENRVGSCLVYAGQIYESSYRYYANFPGTHSTKEKATAAATEQCTSLKGAWKPN
jgi:pyruvate/2-oxoacid:ferredoxin oxidoreductase beta subunit